MESKQTLDEIPRLLEMSGSYPLTDDGVDRAVTRTSPGNYALGYRDGSTFMVFYVGRSDSDVRSRLQSWVGAPSRERYASTSQAAWGTRRRGVSPLDVPALGPVRGVDSAYTFFAYSYAPNAAEAFEKECRNYDDFGTTGGLDNPQRPARMPSLGGV